MTEATQAGLDNLERHVEQFAHQLVASLLNVEMFTASDDLVTDTLTSMCSELAQILDASGLGSAPPELRLELREDAIWFAGEPLVGPSLQAGRLLRLCRERGISALTFGPHLARAELLRFVQTLLSPQDREGFTPENLAACMQRLGIASVRVELEAQTTPEDRESTAPAPTIAPYQAMADFLHDNHAAAHRGDALEVDRAAGVVERALQQMGQEPSGLLAIALYDDIDSFTVGHSVRVCLLALQVANAAGADQETMLRVGTAALLHDIGKSRVPHQVLFKTSRLDEDERQVMAQHSRLGAEILIEQPDVDPTAIGAAFCHHMGPNHSGYPQAALPFEPSGVSKLVRVCDVFEALTAVRPYKPAMTPVHAYAIMRRMRDGFDPRWLAYFVQAIGLYPLGTHVELSTGEEALVVGTGPSPRQPIVRLTKDTAGAVLEPDQATELQVGAQPGHPTAIQAVLGEAERIVIPSTIYTETVDGLHGTVIQDCPTHDGGAIGGACSCTVADAFKPTGD